MQSRFMISWHRSLCSRNFQSLIDALATISVSTLVVSKTLCSRMMRNNCAKSFKPRLKAMFKRRANLNALWWLRPNMKWKNSLINALATRSSSCCSRNHKCKASRSRCCNWRSWISDSKYRIWRSRGASHDTLPCSWSTSNCSSTFSSRIRKTSSTYSWWWVCIRMRDSWASFILFPSLAMR